MLRKKFKIYSDGYNKLYKNYILPSKKIHGYITVMSVHGYSLGLINSSFSPVYENSLINVPDGKPIQILSSIENSRSVERIYGPDLMINIFKILNKNRISKKIFFLGGTKNFKKKSLLRFKKEFSYLNVVGFFDGAVTKMNNAKIVNLINKTSPDIVFVGIGCPKQELFMCHNSGNINALMIGVGAAFDFFTYEKTEAPLWMHNYALGWFYRLLTEPKRLFMRYFIFNTIFIIHILFRISTFYFKKLKLANMNK
jgi:N-acetylglucosaminyldiphosphoundecaprenol N-acetyl-beta-D-mannosaminyltransferase